MPLLGRRMGAARTAFTAATASDRAQMHERAGGGAGQWSQQVGGGRCRRRCCRCAATAARAARMVRHRVAERERRRLGASERPVPLLVQPGLGHVRVRDRGLVVVEAGGRTGPGRPMQPTGGQVGPLQPDHAAGGGGSRSSGRSGRRSHGHVLAALLLLAQVQHRTAEWYAASLAPDACPHAEMPTEAAADEPRCGRPSEMLGIEGELNSDRSLMLARDVTEPYCGSSFSS
uniref:Uncharacterized protein n=1 Tax=Anopheles coluzzii TaxID=1518534 RepID=A0A8W7PN26_ANOCL